MGRARIAGRPGRPPRKVPPVPRRLPTRSPATRDGILAAAEQILVADGPRGLTTNRIAAVAGLSIGSVYQYFPNKEAVVGTIIDRYSQQLFDAVAAALGDRGDAASAELLQAIADRVIAAWRSQAPIHRHLRELDASAGATRRLAETLDRIVELVGARLAGRALAAPPRVVAFAMVHAVAGAINAFAEHGERDPAPLVRVLVPMLTAAVDARPGR